MIEWECFGELIVVRLAFRRKLMILGHEKLEHLGGEKVWQMIKKDLFG